ncbi:MAG: UDP-3-O-[3-hydroxymyristoyl] N-acetylglucosamine deacetylase [Planctomycetes bacterium]|nr:UDP-3-O-[3-hydroxymyristoyl] N-acetylglucosamine deacetylase [Planctomycetota bacterium]
MKGKTLKKSVEFEGLGLFTGTACKVRILPLQDPAGVYFKKIGQKGATEIKVGVNTISDGFRSTVIADSKVEIKSVEHILSSLYGMKVTNAVIEMDGDEIPILDGSSKVFVDAIQKAGFAETTSDIETLELTESLYVRQDESFIVATPLKDKFVITFTIDYPGTAVGKQTYTFDFTDINFAKEIAPARTFCLKNEAEKILQKGLGKGGDVSNTLIIEDINLGKLRFPDEFVRHKILDLLGDLSSLGLYLNAHLVCYKSGHHLNHQLIKKINELRENKRRSVTSSTPILDIKEIQKYLPHRYPMLLIDKVIEVNGYQSAVGVKNVTCNEPYFVGHFPNNPVMPGVLILEAMAQLAGALLIRKAENHKKQCILISLDNVRFRKQVLPGDQLILFAETKKLKAMTCEVYTKATVDDQLASEADMKFMLIEAPQQ